MEPAIKTNRKQLLAALGVAFLTLLAIAWWWRAAEDRRREEEIVTAQGIARVLSATFSNQSALKVGEVSGALDVKSVDPGTFRVFSSSQTVKLPYTVDYSIDLSRLSLGDYRWNGESRTLFVELPDVVPGNPNIDESRRLVIDTDGLFVSRRASANLSRRAAVLATGAAAKEAQKPEHMAKARDNARRTVDSLLAGPLRVAGLGDVKVVARFAQDGTGDPSYLDASRPVNEVLADAKAKREAGE